MDLGDLFRQSCDASSNYPCNLVQSRYPRHALATWADKLRSRHEQLFDGDVSELGLVEVYNGDTFRPSHTCIHDVETLEKHLRQNRKDPTFRYISIQADSSMDALNCSPSMFNYICSFHQIPPSFLDSVFSFGGTLEPLDCSLAAFCPDDTLLLRKEKLLEIPRLGRSGREIRHSYLLRSVEESTSVPGWSWGVRQLAVYHSFDIVTGRSTWITIKGNGLIKDRIREMVSDSQALRLSCSEKALPEAFAATLETHLVILDWCDESWRWCINDIEKSIRAVVNKAKTAKIDAEPRFKEIPEDIKQSVFRSNTSNSKALSRSNTLERTESGAGWMRSFVHKVQRLGSSKGGTESEDATAGRGPTTAIPQDDTSRLDSLLILDMFSFRETQSLQVMAEKVQEALLVTKLNLAVLKQIRTYYQKLAESDVVPEFGGIRSECRRDLANFFSRISSIEDNLGVRKEQLESLVLLIRDGRTLYDSILQYRSLQISRIYAESAHESAKKMRKIAHKTEEETISMHVITFVTLVFLPGTFISTFFQSGIFAWKNVDTGLAPWVFKTDAFTLFATIGLVMMALTFTTWLCLFRCLRRRARKRLEEQQEEKWGRPPNAQGAPDMA